MAADSATTATVPQFPAGPSPPPPPLLPLLLLLLLLLLLMMLMLLLLSLSLRVLLKCAGFVVVLSDVLRGFSHKFTFPILFVSNTFS